VAWCFLTCGIALGSFWAYYELGWGGWWFWDPVENASFMPWLVGTALIHSLAVTEKRGGFKMWTALLALLAFSLSLLGTFIVRSGVLSSVHAFASDPARGVFILAFLALVIGGSLALFAWRAPKVGSGRQFRAGVARVHAAGQQRAAGRGRVRGAAGHPVSAGHRCAGHGQAVGRPAVFRRRVRAADDAGAVPDGRGPDGALAPGQCGRPGLRRLRWAMGVSVVSAVVAFFALGRWTPDDRPGPGAGGLGGQHRRAQPGVACCANTRPRAGRGASMQPGSYYGMLLAHFGVAVFIVGVTVVSGFQSETDVRMEVGDTATVAGYQVRLDSVDP
jgi:cytochrome c-type biogenesis protein CcmF